MSVPKIVKKDPWLSPHTETIQKRIKLYEAKKKELLGKQFKSLKEYASGYETLGCFKQGDEFVIREWLPNASSVFLIGDFSNWNPVDEYKFEQINGFWELRLKNLSHEQKYKLKVYWNGGEGERIPAWVRRVVQDENTHGFDAQLWMPDSAYEWKYEKPKNQNPPIIYEAHIGMGGDVITSYSIHYTKLYDVKQRERIVFFICFTFSNGVRNKL